MPDDSDSTPTVWLIAHGSNGEHESAAVDNDIALLGFEDVPDLSDMTKSEIEDCVRALPPSTFDTDSSPGHVAGMMSAFALEMQDGDVVASPLKNQQGQIAVGTVQGGYEFIEVDGVSRHTRSVKWRKETDSRASYGPDAFHYLVAKRTVSRIKNKAVASRVRLRAVGKPLETAIADPDQPPVTLSTVGVQESARDQIMDRIHKHFPGRQLEGLVAAVLEAQGYVVLEAPKSADQGVDVLAGAGPLGFDAPRLVVQVKHRADRATQPEVQQLHGALAQFQAKRALFVSWSDYTSDAKKMARLNFFSMRLWNANDLLDAIFKQYGDLPEEIRTEIPLKQIWTLALDEEAG